MNTTINDLINNRDIDGDASIFVIAAPNSDALIAVRICVPADQAEDIRAAINTAFDNLTINN